MVNPTTLKTIWTIVDAVSIRHRPKICSARGQYGGLEFNASHAPETRGIEVEILDPDLEARPWSSDILAGFAEYETQRESEGRPIGAVRLAITKIHHHPIDTHSSLMKRLAREAIRKLFEKNEREVPILPDRD